MFVLPTFSRPQQCAEVLRRIRDSGCASKGIVFVNDAKRNESHLPEFANAMPLGWKVELSVENIGCLGALNAAFKANPNEPWYGFIADDEMLAEAAPRDWDQRLIKAAGHWKIAHGWEPWNNGKRCQGYPVWGGDLLRAAGYWALPKCWHWFGLDSHWDWLNGPPAFGGGGLHNLVCLPEIKIYHNRAKPDLVIDECYKLADSRAEEDRKVFWDWIRDDLQPMAERLRKAMKECSP